MVGLESVEVGASRGLRVVRPRSPSRAASPIMHDTRASEEFDTVASDLLEGVGRVVVLAGEIRSVHLALAPVG